MNQKRINFIEDLSRSDLDSLARLLCFPNGNNDYEIANTANTNTGSTSASNEAHHDDDETQPFPPEKWLATQAEMIATSSTPHPTDPSTPLSPTNKKSTSFLGRKLSTASTRSTTSSSRLTKPRPNRTRSNTSPPNPPTSPSGPLFPTHLLRTTSLLPKLIQKLPYPLTAPKAVLCTTHKPLNPFLFRRIFMQLCAETGVRQAGLLEFVRARDSINSEADSHGHRRSRDRSHHHGHDSDDGDRAEERQERASSQARRAVRKAHALTHLKTHLQRLTSLNSLYVSPAYYRSKYLALPQDPRFLRVESGCEACILAYVGGNARAVCDLRASMLGRMRSGQSARLAGLVEAWMRRFDLDNVDDDGSRAGGRGGNRKGEWIREESERVAGLVRDERRRMKRWRRRERRAKRERLFAERMAGGSGKTMTTTTTMIGSERPSQTEKEGRATAGLGGTDGTHDELEDDNDGEDIEVFLGDGTRPREGPFAREAEEHDFEGSIIDYYQANSSVAGTVGGGRSAYVTDTTADDDALHPAFRNSVDYDPTSGNFHRRRPQQEQQEQQQQQASSRYDNLGAGYRGGAASRFTFYTQSAYSQDGGFDSGGIGRAGAGVPETLPATTYNPFVKATSSRRRNKAPAPPLPRPEDRYIAEQRAASYQKLVGIPEDENPNNKPKNPVGGSSSRSSAAAAAAPETVSKEALAEYMQRLWDPEEEEEQQKTARMRGIEEEEEEEDAANAAEERARDERVRKALADAYPDRSSTKRGQETRDERRDTQLTTWSGMMKKGGAAKWFGL